MVIQIVCLSISAVKIKELHQKIRALNHWHHFAHFINNISQPASILPKGGHIAEINLTPIQLF